MNGTLPGCLRLTAALPVLGKPRPLFPHFEVAPAKRAARSVGMQAIDRAEKVATEN